MTPFTLQLPFPTIKTSSEHRGGVALWKKEGKGFSVVVYALHDEAPSSWGVNPNDYDMVELRVLSTRTGLRDFWKPATKRLTHWKRSWILYCTNPAKSQADYAREVSGIKWTVYPFDRYEKEVDHAIEEGEKTFKELSEAASPKPRGNEKPWAQAFQNNTGDPDKDRYWCVAVYPDGDHWLVRVNRGLLKAFGTQFPASWEDGYVFESFKKADDFAKKRIKSQLDNGYAAVTDTKVLRMLKWALHHAVEGD